MYPHWLSDHAVQSWCTIIPIWKPPPESQNIRLKRSTILVPGNCAFVGTHVAIQKGRDSLFPDAGGGFHMGIMVLIPRTMPRTSTRTTWIQYVPGTSNFPVRVPGTSAIFFLAQVLLSVRQKKDRTRYVYLILTNYQVQVCTRYSYCECHSWDWQLAPPTTISSLGRLHGAWTSVLFGLLLWWHVQYFLSSFFVSFLFAEVSTWLFSFVLFLVSFLFTFYISQIICCPHFIATFLIACNL